MTGNHRWIATFFILLVPSGAGANGPVNGKDYLFHWMTTSSAQRLMDSPGFGSDQMPLKTLAASSKSPHLGPTVLGSYPELRNRPGLFAFDHLIGGMTANVGVRELDNYAKLDPDRGVFPALLLMKLKPRGQIRIGEIRTLTEHQAPGRKIRADRTGVLARVAPDYPLVTGKVTSYDLLWHRIMDEKTGHTYFREMIVLNPKAIASYTLSSPTLQHELGLAVKKLSDSSYLLKPHKWHHVDWPSALTSYKGRFFNNPKARLRRFIPSLNSARDFAKQLESAGRGAGYDGHRPRRANARRVHRTTH